MNYALVNGIILNGTKDMEPLYDHVILVHGKNITQISKKDIDLKDYKVIDLEQQYVVPGLINLHVHLAGSGAPKKRKSDPKKMTKLITSNSVTNALGKKLVSKFAMQHLLSGTTTIRTVGGITNYDTTIRNKINSGKIAGPRILASNMAISVPEGHMAGSLAYEALTPEDAEHYVEVIAKDKPDLIKLMITGGILDAKKVGEPGEVKMRPEIVKAACKKAHELGLKVAAHVESPEGVKIAVENGVDSIEHGGKLLPGVLDEMKKTGAFQVLTISPVFPYSKFDRSVSHTTADDQQNSDIVFNGMVSMAKECIENGVPVGLGTDTACPFITQYDTWRELQHFVKFCGVTPAFAIHSATLNNAKLAGISDITGSIEEGKSADLFVVKENPLENIAALRKPTMVMKEGRIFTKKNKKYAAVEKEMDKFL